MFDILSVSVQYIYIHISANNATYKTKSSFFIYLIYFCIRYDLYSIILMFTMTKMTAKLFRVFEQSILLVHTTLCCTCLVYRVLKSLPGDWQAAQAQAADQASKRQAAC